MFLSLKLPVKVIENFPPLVRLDFETKMKLAQTTLSRRDSLKIARRFNAGNGLACASSPAGTAEPSRSFRSSLRDLNHFAAQPGVETPGYCRSSLRDKKASQVGKLESQVGKQASQLDKLASQAGYIASQLDNQASQTVGRPSQVVRTASQVEKQPSQVVRCPSQAENGRRSLSEGRRKSSAGRRRLADRLGQRAR